MIEFKNNKLQILPIDSDKNLFLFRLQLLKTILVMAFGFSLFIATLALFDIFPLTMTYMFILYGYGIINLLIYLLIKYKQEYYFFAINIIVLCSLITFMIMTITTLHDEFRLVWFFLTSFGAFILGGKYYGFLVTFFIASIVLPLYFFYDMNLSAYAIFTFFVALILFNTFAYFFLKKIENDSKHLENRVEEEVQKQQIQEQMLLRQYRMANMGSMLDAIAHQWRQPLMQNNMALLNLYDAIESEKSDKTYLLNKIEDLSKITTHMSQTIEDFRTLLKHDKEMSRVKIDTIVDEVVNLMQNNLKEIALHYEKNSLTVLALKSELIQVFIILISNSIEVLNQKEIVQKEISIGVQSKEGFVEVELEDNAGGVNESIVGKVFDPYFTTKKEQGGTGLGLYIAKIMVEQNMEGRLSVSNGTKGAKFSVRLKKGESNESV
ncbi:MAG TPA: HAMP domain-containing histidine kinase [Campylobacterales bacterium]|nr:HAMP domain-containing histidine kinase [Campylobacterales bacterium]